MLDLFDFGLIAMNWVLLVGIGLILAAVVLWIKYKEWWPNIINLFKKLWWIPGLLGLGMIVFWGWRQWVEEDTSPIKAQDLVDKVVATLESNRASMARSDISFESAELELSVKTTDEKGVKANLAVLKGGASRKAENVLKVTYKLKDWLDVAKVGTEIIKADAAGVTNLDTLEKIVKPLRIKGWRPMPVDSIKELVKGINKISRPFPAADPLSRAIRSALEDYRGMKDKFGQVCLVVEISFDVTLKGEIEIGAEIIEKVASISGSQSLSKGHKHSIKISFGKCS